MASEDLPSALPTMWRTMRRGFRAEPKLVVLSFVVAILSTVPDSLAALWLMYVADGVIEKRSGLVWAASLGLAVSTVAGWLLRLANDRIQRKFRMRVGVALEMHVADLQSSIPTIEHQERPEYLDRLAVLRDSVFFLDHMYSSMFATVSAMVRLIITIVLLMSVSPVLALLAVFAVPIVLVSSMRSGAQRRSEERAAPHHRLARHLFTIGTTAGPAKEIRLTGNADRIAGRWQAERGEYYKVVSRTQWVTSVWMALAWGLFAGAYAAAVVYTTAVLHQPAGSVLLVVAAGGRLGQYITMTADEVEFMRRWLDASSRLGWLENYADRQRSGADQPVPGRLRTGIQLENVSFRYPGTSDWVLRDVSLHLPPGAVVALVGENGAGKSTLVKLLCQLYHPTSGRIMVDGVDLNKIPHTLWRARLAGAFQDFARFEFQARSTVGLGDLPRHDDDAAVSAAVERAGATDVLLSLPSGADTQLGAGWPEGVDLSFGQWQKLALARGFMRDEPLLTILDEPTAALDAETEHALFDQYAAQSRIGARNGQITVLVSHRFSTVRMADLIVVIDGSRVIQVGSHDELVADGGTYADLYELQAGAYR
jgi:ATP-binding cassette subfamily B protein